MNVTVDHDNSGTMFFNPDVVTLPTGLSTISITMVPPSGAGWTIDGVSSSPSATWSGNTASLGEGAFDITIDASVQSKSGTSCLRITIGV